VSPVFLFDMSVIVFVISTAAGKVDGMSSFGKMSEEVIIEKLASIVAIKAKQEEGQSLFDLFELFEGVGFAFTPDGALFGPSGGNVDTVDGIGEHAGEGVATMGDGVGFEKAGFGFIPLMGLDRDLPS
jgi:hypothetical protein